MRYKEPKHRTILEATTEELVQLLEKSKDDNWKPIYHIHPEFGLLNDPNVLAYFNTDLKARGMMGDTGSNVLGISIGVLMALGYGIKVRLAWLVFLILMHLITEKFSLTKIIEKNRVLKFIDNLGR